MSSSELPSSDLVNLKRVSSPANHQEETKDNGIVVSSAKSTIGSIHEEPCRKFDHNALLAEYDDDYQKDAVFEAGQIVLPP
jgi:hypothetical protein